MDKRMERCYEFLMKEFQLVSGKHVFEAMEYANWQDNFENHNIDRGIPPFYIKKVVKTYHQKFMDECSSYLERKRFVIEKCAGLV